VGLTHVLRGNARGATTLLERGAGNIAGYPAEPYGVDVPGLVRWARQLAADPQPGSAPPRLVRPGIPPAPGADSRG
jgi:hypothetical protein